VRAVILLLILAACGARIVERPVMAPVDRPAVPKGIAVPCEGAEAEPIRLPTDAATQITARQRDQEAADAAIAECDRRRSRAVQYLRRLGIDL